jgi:hypothetical protein
LGNIYKIYPPNQQGYQTVLVNLPKTSFNFKCVVSPQVTYYLNGARVGDPIGINGYVIWEQTDQGIVFDHLKVITLNTPRVVAHTPDWFADNLG